MGSDFGGERKTVKPRLWEVQSMEKKRSWRAWRGREAAPKPRGWRGSPVGGGRNGKKAKNREKMEMQGSGRTAGGLEGQDGAERAWRGVGSGRKVGHAPSRAGAWVTGRRRRAARGGAWDAGFRWGFHWRVDQPPAVRNMWSVPGKEVAGKGCRRGRDPTAMRLSGVVREGNEGTGVKHGHWTVRRNWVHG